MLLFTKAQRERLIKNNNEQDGSKSFAPVVKLFNAWGQGTWYLSELDPETNIAYGLCDLGYPELGYVSIDELQQVLGRRLERDMYWDAPKTMKECVEKYS